VARIIYVEDEPEWLDLTRHALAGHQMDAASTFQEAVGLIQANDYDLALVDLNLQESNDRLGGEILDLLRLDHPDTRLIVVTAHPPIGGLRANIFVRYGVDEVILKGPTTLPDLRRIVTEVLRGDPAADIATDTKIARSELMQRYLDWHGHLERVIRTGTREADGGGGRPGRKRRPNGVTSNDSKHWVQLREDFVRVSISFEQTLSAATELPGIEAANEQLNELIDEFASRHW
jgi:CheY-like chemotaxis protein